MTRPSTEQGQMLETAIAAARLAGQHAQEQLRYIHRTIKNGNELVTQADPACQKIIIDHIRQHYPEHGLIAEEGPDGKLFHCPPRTGTPIWWVIDPIDGTNNYANGLLCFCVSIAAMYEGEPILGVIFDPATDSIFTAAQDMDAQLNGSRITVSEDDINPFASFAVDSHLNPETNKGIQEMVQQTRFRCLGSTALHLAYVAKGAMIGMAAGSAKLWDIAAGAILIERAGGIVTDFHGNPLFPVALGDYNSECFGILATNQKIHKHTLEIFLEK
ncbi:MAG: inositol monophosphatase [Planctomycetes bacterium]|nr:inositol monophosphatase [Planctomycetota bacterium]